ncbi:hypothetical protein CSUI_008998 [Cystoisospora suis]|uniref:Transmembrane protein n=1 Tax=Cystoisospora suis TaxID=483139 RepID=A0A2C6KL36_9APIC|nr:hypothetical protein CSUI_008998 [Cystoisospora suis]
MIDSSLSWVLFFFLSFSLSLLLSLSLILFLCVGVFGVYRDLSLYLSLLFFLFACEFRGLKSGLNSFTHSSMSLHLWYLFLFSSSLCCSQDSPLVKLWSSQRKLQRRGEIE